MPLHFPTEHFTLNETVLSTRKLSHQNVSGKLFFWPPFTLHCLAGRAEPETFTPRLQYLFPQTSDRARVSASSELLIEW